MYHAQTWLTLLLKGGWLMYPLFLLSLAAVYIMVERLLTYRRQLHYDHHFLEALSEQLQLGDWGQVQRLCATQDNVIQQVMEKGLQRPQLPMKNMEAILEAESNKAIALLEENLSLLATIAGIAPMIGFLGTVIGMIQTFMAIAEAHNHPSTQLFSSGIYEAMLTTVVGLIVSIIAYIGYSYFTARVNKVAQQLTYLATLFLHKR